MIGHAEDNLEQNQSDDFIDTQRNTIDWQNDIALVGANTLTAGLLWQDEEADATSIRLRRSYASDIDDEPVLPAGPGDLRSRIACCSAAPIPITKLSAATRPGTSNMASPSKAAAPHALRRHGLPGAGCDGSLQHLRRQPGSRAGGIDRATRSAFASRSANSNRVSITAFRNDIDDLIDFVVTDPVPSTARTGTSTRRASTASRPPGSTRARNGPPGRRRRFQDPRDRTTDERLLRRAARTTRPRSPAASARTSRPRRPLRRRTARFRLPEPGRCSTPTGSRTLRRRSPWANTLLWSRERRTCSTRTTSWPSGYNTMGRSFFGALRYEFR